MACGPTPIIEFLSQTYVALRGPTGVIRTPEDIIVHLSNCLLLATLLVDRYAAVLTLKGLVCDVGDRALTGLLEVLSNDAEVNEDMGKAVLEDLLVKYWFLSLSKMVSTQGLYRRGLSSPITHISKCRHLKGVGFEGAFKKLFNIIGRHGG